MPAHCECVSVFLADDKYSDGSMAMAANDNPPFWKVSKEDLAELVSHKDAKRTKCVIKNAVSILEKYCVEVGTVLPVVEDNPT